MPLFLFFISTLRGLSLLLKVMTMLILPKKLFFTLFLLALLFSAFYILHRRILTRFLLGSKPLLKKKKSFTIFLMSQEKICCWLPWFSYLIGHSSGCVFRSFLWHTYSSYQLYNEQLIFKTSDVLLQGFTNTSLIHH